MEIVERILLLKLESEMDNEVPRAFAISDIQSSPLETKGPVYSSCVISDMIDNSETRQLLDDVGLKFERAEMQLIR